MKLLITADLHYNIARCRPGVRRLAREACAAGGDAIVLVGDTAGSDLAPLRECLRLFADFPGRRFMVAGNHCLWTRDTDEGASLRRYRQTLPDAAADEGFEMLDHAPAFVDGVGLVGTVGWYDYSFRDRSLGIPEAFYRAKLAPGAAAYLGGHEDLLAAHRDDLTDAHLALGARWMDGVHVRLGISDEAFVEDQAHKLARHLADAERRSERVLAFLHHLPFAELVPTARPPRFAFAAAFMGSGRLGEPLLACRKLTDVYCGHSHWAAEARIKHIRAVNVGSTYTEKKLCKLEW